jgi:Mn-dependent DtxR family transcriptional regulator
MSYNLDKILKAIKLKNEGFKASEISQILNVSERTVFRYLKKEKKLKELIDLRYRIFRLKEEQPSLKIDEISKILNISKDKVFRVLRDYGLCGFKREKFEVLYFGYVKTDVSEKFLKMRIPKLVGTVSNIELLNKYSFEELPTHLKLNKIALDLSYSLNYEKAISEINKIIPKLKEEKLNYSLIRAYVILGSCALWLGNKELMKISFENLNSIKHNDICIKFYTLLMGSLISEEEHSLKFLKSAYKILKKLKFPNILTSDFIAVSSTKGYYNIPIENLEKYAYPSTAIIILTNQNNFKKVNNLLKHIDDRKDRALAKGYIYFMKGYIEKAIREFLKTYQFKHLKVQAGILLSICYIAIGEKEKAISIYNEIKNYIITDRAREILEFSLFLDTKTKFSIDSLILLALKNRRYKRAINLSKKYSNTFTLRLGYILFKTDKLKDYIPEFYKNFHLSLNLKYKFDEKFLIFKIAKKSIKIRLSNEEMKLIKKLFENKTLNKFQIIRISSLKDSSIYKLIYKINKSIGFKIIYMEKGNLKIKSTFFS